MFVKLPSYPMILSADAGARQAGSSPRLTAVKAPCRSIDCCDLTHGPFFVAASREAPAETRRTNATTPTEAPRKAPTEASREAPSIPREAPAVTRLTIIEAVKTLAFVAAIFVCGFLTRPAIMSDKWHDQVLVSCVSSVILLGKVFLWFLVPLILFWFYVEFKAYQVSLSNTH